MSLTSPPSSQPYLVMAFKITCLIVPPPIDKAFSKKHAEEDWEYDTKGKNQVSGAARSKAVSCR